MIDTVRLNINAGNGGNGCISFLREKYKPRGGPNGGDGGDGGSAYLVGDSSLNTMLHLSFNSTYYVQRGGHGKGKDMTGGGGSDTFIKVPLGTTVWKMYPDSDRNNEFLADIVDENPYLVARGGAGGWGNHRYVTSTNQEPMLAENGQAGESVVVFLELKLLADVGLLAKPNAGKSTLISRCSAAKPKIADYPFTTVEPVLGVVNRHQRDFVMMEVPGLLEGAHDGVGLGDQFLRHAERARLYLHVVDGMSQDPIGDFRMINEELFQFNPELAAKPQVLVVSKLDITEVQELREYLEMELKEAAQQSPSFRAPQFGESSEVPIFFISAVTGEGINQLLDHVLAMLDVLPKNEELQVQTGIFPGTRGRHPLRRRGPNTFHKVKDVFVIDSEEMVRLSATADMRDRRVMLQLWRQMTRLGIAAQLQQAEIEPGDTIRIGRVEMEWF